MTDAPAIAVLGLGEAGSAIATDLARVVGHPHLAPEVTGKYRAGDIRHCSADIRKSREQLGFSPEVDFEAGLQELAEWLADQQAEDSVEAATRELESRGLVA